MARTLSGPLGAKAIQQYGAEPLTVVKIEWPTGTRYYSDKAYTFGIYVCEPKILELGNIVSQVRSEASSDVGSASLSLDDTDATIKNSVNRDLIAGTKCTVYQTYSSLSIADSLIILSGRISNDIAWSEGQRTISFTIDTNFQVNELGHAPKRGELANLSVDAEGKLWPIVFGSCLNVPAVQIYKTIYGDYPNSEVMSFTPGSTFYVSGGENFPTGSIKIRMKQGVCLQGSFTGNLFTVTANNVAYHTNLAIAARVADPDELNPSVLWLSGQRYLVGQYCYIDDGVDTMSNLCTYQEGKKCWFAKPWKKLGQNNPVALAAGTIDETSHFYRTTWTVPFQVEVLVGTVWTPVNYYTTWYAKYYRDVALVTTTIPTFIVNNAASTIKGVFAYRTYLGKRTLDAVPSHYYTKYESTVIDGQTVTALEFHNELTDYVDEGWEGEIFVSLVSSLSANTSAVIEHLLSYTDYTVDGSFATVAAKITNYPSNFAILDQQDVLGLIADIAYQARLAVRYNGTVAKLHYISEIPATVSIFNNDSLRQKTLDYGFTSVEDIVTKFTAIWKPSYTAKDLEYVYKNNIATFGTKEDDRNYFIYNIESLVKLSVDFWGNRASNSWRTCKFATFLQALPIEAFDCVRVDTVTLATAGIRGEVTTTSHDTVEDAISIEVKLASKSGSHSAGVIIEDTTFFTGGVTGSEPAPADPTNGLAERDYFVYHEPKEVSTPDNKITKYIRFVTTPANIVRGQAFSISAKIISEDESIFNVNETFVLAISEANDTDTLNIATITFVNGLATVSRTASDGTLDTEAVLNIVGKTVGETTYQTALSDGIPITSEPTLVWSVDHTANERNATFSVSFSGGLPSTAYSVSLNSQDPDEKLYDGTTEVTTFTTDVSGNYTAVWSFGDGTFALNSVIVTAAHTGHNYPSPEFLVIDAGGSSNIVVQSTIAGALAGDVVMNSGTAWVLADPSDANITTKTKGIVGQVKTGDVCYIVCRGLVCIEGLTAHTDYNLVSIGTLGTGSGRFVLRSYAGNLCWVGGGTAIARVTDIKDVDNTVVLTDGMILRYNGTLWIPATVDNVMFSVFTSTGDTIAITHVTTSINLEVKKVLVNKIEQIADKSILANVSGGLAAPSVLTAVTVGHLLRVATGGTLGFGTIGDASINDLAWGKLTGVPSFAAAVHVHTLSGDVTGDVTGAVTIAANAVTTAKILDGNVTNAKLANSTMTINGVSRALGSTFTIDGFANPMTTLGDMIIGGASGVPTRLGVNAGTTIQILRSVGGVTSFVSHILDGLEDVIITTPANGEILTYETATTSWKNKPAAAGGSTTVMAIGKVTAQDVTYNYLYTIEVYPHGLVADGGDVTWSSVSAKMLQIGAASPKVPVNTWIIAIGTLKVPTPSPLANNATDYNWYIQPPIWM